MTYKFFTYPPKIYVIISYVKEIRFWNSYLPTFWLDVIKYPVFFFDRFPKTQKIYFWNGAFLEKSEENRPPLKLKNNGGLLGGSIRGLLKALNLKIFQKKGTCAWPRIDTICFWGQNQNLKNWSDTYCFFAPEGMNGNEGSIMRGQLNNRI